MAAIILLSNFSFGNSHLAYAHVSYLDASLEMDHFLLPMEEYIAWKITASFIEKNGVHFIFIEDDMSSSHCKMLFLNAR